MPTKYDAVAVAESMLVGAMVMEQVLRMPDETSNIPKMQQLQQSELQRCFGSSADALRQHYHY
jgi:hypothetical protein